MRVALQPVSSVDVADKSTWDLTTPRTIRMEGDLWDRLGPAAKASGYSRSGLLVQFARWYLRVPGAALPPRPPARRHLLDEAEKREAQ